MTGDGRRREAQRHRAPRRSPRSGTDRARPAQRRAGGRGDPGGRARAATSTAGARPRRVIALERPLAQHRGARRRRCWTRARVEAASPPSARDRGSPAPGSSAQRPQAEQRARDDSEHRALTPWRHRGASSSAPGDGIERRDARAVGSAARPSFRAFIRRLRFAARLALARAVDRRLERRARRPRSVRRASQRGRRRVQPARGTMAEPRRLTAAAQQQRARGFSSRIRIRRRSKSRRDITGWSGWSRRMCST